MSLAYLIGPRRNSQTYGRVTTLISPLLGLMFIICIIAMQFLHLTFVRATTNEPLAFVGNTLSPLIVYSRTRGFAASNQQLTLSIGLRPRNTGAMQRYAQDLAQPDRGSERRFLTPAQYSEQFSPLETTYKALQQFLKDAGFTITNTYTHRLLIDFSGSVEQVQQAFHVSIQRYLAPDGTLYTANSNAPQLPAWLAAQVLSINGLISISNWRHPAQPDYPIKALADGRPNLNWCAGPAQEELRPEPLASASNPDGTLQMQQQGAGQTIALFELNTFNISDLTNYIECVGHRQTNLQVELSGASAAASSAGLNAVEMDSERILNAAPQLDSLKIYATSNEDSDYLSQWAHVLQDGPAIIATNWSHCETDSPQQTMVQEHVLLQAAILLGQHVVNAPDAGNMDCPHAGR